MNRDEELKEAQEWLSKYSGCEIEDDGDRGILEVMLAYHHHRLEVEREKMKKKTIENLIG